METSDIGPWTTKALLLGCTFETHHEDIDDVTWRYGGRYPAGLGIPTYNGDDFEVMAKHMVETIQKRVAQ